MTWTTVRDARIGDLQQIFHIEQRTQPVPWSMEGLHSELLLPHSRFWVLCPSRNDDEVLGYMSFREVAGEVYLSNLSVAPDHQGKGLGSRLMEAAMDFWKGRGLLRVVLDVHKSNSRAISFYRSKGFRLTCPLDVTKGDFCVMEMKLFQE